MAAFSRFVQPELCRPGSTPMAAMVDSPQGLKAHPALPELRQQRIALARLVAALGLPTGLVEDQPKRQRRSARGVYDISGGQS